MIFKSHPMYFDPIRTMVKFKNQMHLIKGVFWPKNRPKNEFYANSADFCLFSPKIRLE